MKKVLSTVAFAFVVSLAFSQLKVVAPNGDVGIGTSTPTAKLDVEGAAVSLGSGQAGALDIDLGAGRTASGNTRVDLMGGMNDESTWGYGFRFLRSSNGSSRFYHRGTAQYQFRAEEAANITFWTNLQSRMSVRGNGDLELITGEAYKTGTSTWALLSDRRLKKGIKTYDKGLNEVMQINPVYFRYTDKVNPKSPEYVGIIAQEVEEYAPEMIREYEMTDYNTDKSLGEFKTVNPNDFTYMLINATQQQQELIEAQTALIEDLAARLLELEEVVKLSSNEAQQDVELNSFGALNQNSPNPFNSNTQISYSLPANTQNAYIQVNDMGGALVKTIKLANDSKGALNIKAGSLNPGTYNYSLIVEGNIVDTKKMVLTK